MSTEAASGLATLSRLERLRVPRKSLRKEGQALLSLWDSLGEGFCSAVDVMLDCRGRILESGLGQAGLLWQEIAAKLGPARSPGTTAMLAFTDA